MLHVLSKVLSMSTGILHEGYLAGDMSTSFSLLSNEQLSRCRRSYNSVSQASVCQADFCSVRLYMMHQCRK